MNFRLFFRAAILAVLIAGYVAGSLAARHLTMAESPVSITAATTPVTAIAPFMLWPLIAVPTLLQWL
jgi:hypothetical protein